MTQNIHEPSLYRQVSSNRFGVKGQKQKPGASRWITPSCSTISPALPDGECEAWWPDLQNNWQQPSSPLESFSFRLHMDGSLETKGHLDASGGAVSGSIALTFPGAADGDPDYLLPHDQYWHTVITTDDGTTFQIALVFIEAASGDMTITWPAA